MEMPDRWERPEAAGEIFAGDDNSSCARRGRKKSRLKIRRLLNFCRQVCLFFCDEWQQANESCSQHCCSDGTLIKSGRASAAARKNAAFTVDQVSQGLQVFVVHVHWTWNFTTAREHAAHLFLFQTSTAFTKFL